jgi:hypothetical protein
MFRWRCPSRTKGSMLSYSPEEAENLIFRKCVPILESGGFVWIIGDSRMAETEAWPAPIDHSCRQIPSKI